MNVIAFRSRRCAALPLTVFLMFGLPALLPAPAIAQEKALAPENNPPGDIPDSQVFVAYRAPQGFSLKVPEGWSRKDRGDSMSFADKYGQIVVSLRPGAAPTMTSARANEAADLEKTGRAVKISAITEVKLPAGPAVRIAYTENSEANAVTGKQIRLESERFLIARGGNVATLTFSAPAGADNADQWKLMSDSFAWN